MAYPTNTFSVAGGANAVTNQFDGNGNVTKRVWVNSDRQTNRTQTFTWDAFDRLIRVTDRDSVGSGQDWAGVFDGLGRKVRTMTRLVVSNTPITDPAEAVSTVDSWFDPLVEFQEVGVVVNGGVFNMKTYGPDANGVHGGLQGVGGLERVTPFGHMTGVGLLQDYFGNIIGTVTNKLYGVNWNPARFSSYGPAPGYQPPALTLNANLAQSVGWRGKHIEPTGVFYWGARPYEPASGRFLAHDPVCDPANPGGYSVCGGDLVNCFDADSRDGVSLFQILAPVTYSATGARPYPGSFAGDVQVSRLFNAGTLPIQLPGLIVTSEPFQRGVQVIGGLGEAGVGAAGFVGTSPTVVGSIFSAGAVVNGLDNVQAGLRGIPTFTEQSFMSLGASPTWASVGNAAFGFGLTLGSSLTRVQAMPPTTTWTTRLSAGVGETDAFGNMTLSSLGTDLDRAQVALHEGVHSFLSPPAGGFVNTLRADAGMAAYQNSQLFRYGEEALAEVTAQWGTRDLSGLSFSDALMNGLRFPLENNYGLSLGRIGLEAAGGATGFGGGLYFGSQLNLGNGAPSLGKKPH